MKKDWAIKKLAEVSEIVCGGTPDTKVPEYWDGEYLWITPKDMGKLKNTYVDDTERKISGAGLRNSSAKMLPPNSIILSTRAPIGHLAINNREIATNQGCKGIVPDKELSTVFLFYFLKNSKELLNNLGNGTTFKELSTTKLAEVTLPLPPLLEQQRIVAILDKAFDAIDKAKENTEKNLQNACELFESYLQSIFSNPSEGWGEKNLAEVCLIKPAKNEARRKLDGSDIVSFVPMENLGINQKYFYTARGKPLNEVEGSYTYFAEGDVLLAKITPCFENGKLGIAKNLINRIGFGSSEYVVFRPKEYLYNEFLYYFLSRKQFRCEGKQRMSGAVGHKRVAKDFIEDYKIHIPLLSDQKAIVEKLDAISFETKKLEAIYQNKLADLDEMKKSILQKAFSGELTEAQ